MNYIYDIYLNLNDVLYDFFDWNKNDKLIHIKKIPIFKIDDQDLNKIVYNSIKVNNTFLKNVYNKTELWNMADKIEFCALFSSNNDIIAIEFDEYGKSVKKSFLQVDEELEILETIHKIPYVDIYFEIIKKNNSLLKTRKQLKEENFIRKELKSIEKEKLDYIYFECFGKKEKNRKIILQNLESISKNSKIYKNLYDILKLTSTTKNKML